MSKKTKKQAKPPENKLKGKRVYYWMPAYNMQCSARIRSQAQVDGAWSALLGYTLISSEAHGCDLVRSRNEALDRCVRRDDLDYLFMQDSDVYSVPPDGSSPLARLMTLQVETGAAMTGAMVLLRTRPPIANTYPTQPGSVYEVEKMGTGMVLIDLHQVRQWYHQFTGPCFARSYKRNELEDGRMDNRMAESDVGLDIWFCKVLRGHGQTIWCDGRIPTVHQDATRTVNFDGVADAFIDNADSADSEVPTGRIPGL